MLDLHISPPLNIFYIFLGSLVLFKDSKTMVRYFNVQERGDIYTQSIEYSYLWPS